MGTALVAYVDRDQCRIELDPAVRVGARLDSDGEAILLHTTAWGHCGDTARAVARRLRDTGWTVTVRTFNELDSLTSSASAAVFETNGAEADELIGSDADLGTTPSVRPPRTRQRCRVCGHLTVGKGVRSHVANLGHDDWEAVRVSADGAVTRARTQA